MGGKALRVQPGHEGVQHLQRNHIQGGGSKNVVLIETPSIVVSPPISETDNTDEMDNVGIINIHDGPEDGDILRDVPAYDTSRINFNNDVTYDHHVPIVRPRDPVIAEILPKIGGLTQADLMALKVTPGAPADGVGGQESSTYDDNGRQQPEARGGSGKQGRLDRGMASI